MAEAFRSLFLDVTLSVNICLHGLLDDVSSLFPLHSQLHQIPPHRADGTHR